MISEEVVVWFFMLLIVTNKQWSNIGDYWRTGWNELGRKKKWNKSLMYFKYHFIVHPYLIDFIVSIWNELSEIPWNVIMVQFVPTTLSPFQKHTTCQPIVYTSYSNYSEKLRKFNYRTYIPIYLNYRCMVIRILHCWCIVVEPCANDMN